MQRTTLGGCRQEEDLAVRHAALLEHYGVEGTRNNRGMSHNNCIEAPRRLRDCPNVRGTDLLRNNRRRQPCIDQRQQQVQHPAKTHETAAVEIHHVPRFQLEPVGQ